MTGPSGLDRFLTGLGRRVTRDMPELAARRRAVNGPPLDPDRPPLPADVGALVAATDHARDILRRPMTPPAARAAAASQLRRTAAVAGGRGTHVARLAEVARDAAGLLDRPATEPGAGTMIRRLARARHVATAFGRGRWAQPP